MAEPSGVAWLDCLFAQICKRKQVRIPALAAALGPCRGLPSVLQALGEQAGSVHTEQDQRVAQ